MHQVDHARREALKQGSATAIFGLFVAAGLVRPGTAHAAWNQAAFSAKTVDAVVKGLGGASTAPTKDVNWGSTPEIAENGAVVPVSVTSNVPKTESISILVEKNPNALAATFTIPAGTDPTVSTRVKMGETSQVHALIKADGKYLVATREIKVTLGGCGG
ncbi:MAG: thiosulfate oxidation carrier protein SoxY [Burkholderiales bacterium]|nr:thiosulfate oxidation carrier protein SoxY [Burkholderiales bacterium]